MITRNISSLLGMGLTFAAVAFYAIGAHGQKTPPPTRVSESQVLTYLPVGAKLADIPFVQFGPTAEIRKTRPNVLYADVDGDGREEVIVAYYTTPHEYIINGQGQEGFFRRAHVKVLDWDGEKYVDQWDSGGWGSEFRAKMDPKLERNEQELYTAHYFNVTDINNDGIAEILFTRCSFLAEGDHFQMFGWNGERYEAIALVLKKVRLGDQDNDGIKELICDYDYKGRKLASPDVYKWDGKTYEAIGERAGARQVTVAGKAEDANQHPDVNEIPDVNKQLTIPGVEQKQPAEPDDKRKSRSNILAIAVVAAVVILAGLVTVGAITKGKSGN